MTKLIVETKGPYQLSGSLMDGSDRVPHDRPAVVTQTTYIELRIKSDVSGLRVLAEGLPDTATDAGFLDTLKECEGDVELAVEAYVSEVGADAGAEPEKKETAAERKKRLAEEKKADEEKAAAAEADKKRGKEGFSSSDAVPKPQDGKLTPSPSTDIELQKG